MSAELPVVAQPLRAAVLSIRTMQSAIVERFMFLSSVVAGPRRCGTVAALFDVHIVEIENEERMRGK
jgi:hypothetical protein